MLGLYFFFNGGSTHQQYTLSQSHMDEMVIVTVTVISADKWRYTGRNGIKRWRQEPKHVDAVILVVNFMSGVVSAMCPHVV